jgi:hypothetical protein
LAENGALELPYLSYLGVEPRYEGPKNMEPFLLFFTKRCIQPSNSDVKIYIDTLLIRVEETF